MYRHQTGHIVLLFQPACDTLTALILFPTEFVPCCGAATELTLSWVAGRFPAALLSTVFSHRFLHRSINTCTLFFDVWLPIFACIQFTKKSACSVPVSCPVWEFPLPQSSLPATGIRIFFGFSNHCKHYTAHGQNTVPMGPKEKLSISHSHLTFEASQLVIKVSIHIKFHSLRFLKENTLQQKVKDIGSALLFVINQKEPSWTTICA